MGEVAKPNPPFPLLGDLPGEVAGGLYFRKLDENEKRLSSFRFDGEGFGTESSTK